MPAVLIFVGGYAAFGFAMRFVAIGNTAGTGKCGCKRDIPAVAEVS